MYENYVQLDNLQIQQGDDRSFTWDLTDQEGNPVDTSSGFSAHAQLRSMSSPHQVLQEWKSQDGTATFGTSSVSLKTTGSSAWTWDFGVYDLKVTDSLNRTEVIARGTMVLLPSYTHV